jgi:hypothetical protein
MPILGVCGDSYLSATVDGDRSDIRDSSGRHFSEILAKKLGYNYFTLARAACSNSAIRLQIDQMISEKVDFVIVGTTRSDRLEYPAKENKDRFHEFFGIYNFVYNTHPDLSSTNEKFNLNNMFTETITNVLSGNYGYRDVVNEDQRESIKRYFQDIYDHQFKQVQDTWIIADGIKELIRHKIPYIVLLHDFFHYHSFFTLPNIRHLLRNPNLPNQELIPYTYDSKFTSRRWHTLDEDQVDIANHMCNYIQSNNLLVWSE